MGCKMSDKGIMIHGAIHTISNHYSLASQTRRGQQAALPPTRQEQNISNFRGIFRILRLF